MPAGRQLAGDGSLPGRRDLEGDLIDAHLDITARDMDKRCAVRSSAPFEHLAEDRTTQEQHATPLQEKKQDTFR
jgi:hypothetical protein